MEVFTEAAGTAALCGRDLPPADVLAADANLTALAHDLRKAGAAGTLDQLRARAYLHLLTGQHPDALLAAVTTATQDGAGQDSGTRDSTAGGAVGRDTRGEPADSGVAGAPGSSTPGDGTPASGPGIPGPDTPWLSVPGLRGTVHLTIPLVTWLGWSQAPGDAAGFGPLDADDSRDLTTWLARNPATQWCLTLTDPAGHAIAHGCAPTGPGHPPGRPSPGRDGPRRDSPGRDGPGQDGSLGTSPREPNPWETNPREPNPWDWLCGITLTPLQTGACTHPRQSRAYRPPASLRHLIEIRNASCTAPGCRRPATTCDVDHTTPHGRGGRSCECNLGPLCRRHHRCKQAPRWTLIQPTPGIFRWTTPAGRTYTTTPTSYSA